jgi:hypothetical protein
MSGVQDGYTKKGLIILMVATGTKCLFNTSPILRNNEWYPWSLTLWILPVSDVVLGDSVT